METVESSLYSDVYLDSCPTG